MVEMRNKAENSYRDAYDRANEELKKYHPIRLGLMLNMSIFYYEVQRDRFKGIQLSLQV